MQHEIEILCRYRLERAQEDLQAPVSITVPVCPKRL